MIDFVMRKPFIFCKIDDMDRRTDIFIRALRKNPPAMIADVYSLMIQVYFNPSLSESMVIPIAADTGKK